MIKKYDASKADKVMDIWLSANLATHPFVPREYFINNVERVQGMLLESDVIVYERDGRILGFAGVVKETGDPKLGYLSGMFIKEGFRDEGIGGALIDELKKKYDALELHVYKANDKAIAFYKRRGFVVQSEGLNEETRFVEYMMRWTKD